MKNLTREELHTEYLIYKELTPKKKYKTYLALKEHSDGMAYSVILKEMDEKRAGIYSYLSSVWNPYIASTYDIFLLSDSVSPADNRFVAITENVCAEGHPEERLSLTQFIQNSGSLSENAALSVCVQICEGLKEFHKNGYVHRDLKPDNIMISKYDLQNPQIKIIDFGGAKSLSLSEYPDTTVIGTLGYQAPESLSSHTTNRADIYSIGCILNFMLTGAAPGTTNYTGNHYIVSIIEKATNEDPSHRYANVTALQKALEHELRIRILDQIPYIRALPGFRTHTLWKETIALLIYITVILAYTVCISAFDLWGFMELLIFYAIAPMIIIFNMGNLLRFFPKNVRQNNRLYFSIRVILLLASTFGIAFIDYLLGRG